LSKISALPKWIFKVDARGVCLSSRTKALFLILILLGAVALLGAASLGERTAASLRARGVDPRLIVLVISMVPIIELRGAIPVAMAVFGMSWQEAALISVVGNMLPIPLILLFLDWFLNLIGKFRWGRRLTEWLFKRTRNKGKSIERYEELGLAVFVGIPLPGTGAWTGALIAKVFGLNFWKSLFWIFVGVLLAATAVTAVTYLGTSLAG